MTGLRKNLQTSRCLSLTGTKHRSQEHRHTYWCLYGVTMVTTKFTTCQPVWFYVHVCLTLPWRCWTRLTLAFRAPILSGCLSRPPSSGLTERQLVSTGASLWVQTCSVATSLFRQMVRSVQSCFLLVVEVFRSLTKEKTCKRKTNSANIYIIKD